MSLAHVVKMYLKGEKVMGDRIKKQSSIVAMQYIKGKYSKL